MMGAMSERAEIVVVGAGVQGASLAFHLARRGADVLVVEKESVASGATGRSSGFVRMHYDLESEAVLAYRSFPYFTAWDEHVGAGDPGFVRTGFLQLVEPALAPILRENVATHRRIGIDASVLGPDEVARLVPGIVVEGIVAAAYEPASGYADPTGTAMGFLAAARRHGARYSSGRRVARVLVEGDRVVGIETDAGAISAPVVVVAAGAWAAELAATAGVEVPVRAWRHETAYFGLPPGRRTTEVPIVIDHPNAVYFRPEGSELLLVGLEGANEIGGSADRPFRGLAGEVVERMVGAVCRRLPWMEQGDFRTAHGGQDGITPDQRAIIDRAGPDGLYLLCGFSGTGFKTAPAIGASLAELILDGRTTTADLSDFRLARFAEGRLLAGAYGPLWIDD